MLAIMISVVMHVVTFFMQLHLLHDKVTLRVREVRDPSVSAQAVETHAPMTAAQTTRIGSTLYVGGGQNTTEPNVRNHVLAIDCKHISVSELPNCPVIQFGLGNIGGKLLAIGGRNPEDEIVTDKIYELENSVRWKESTIPTLSKPRARICVVSQTEDENSACIVACGGLCVNGTTNTATNIVEVYQKDSLRWITVTPLPNSRAALRATVLHNTVYFLGGYEDLSKESMPDCFSISRNNLFCDNPNKVWDKLSDLPSQSATPAHICSTLLAIGGITPLTNDATSKRAISCL